MIERENGTLKNKLVKCCEETGLSWPKAIQLVLTYMRMRVRTRTNMSPFEIIFARPLNLGIGPPTTRPVLDTNHYEHDMSYCKNLSNLLSDISKQVSVALSAAADRPLHQLKPGDWVLVRNFRKKQLKSRRWQGPFQILLTTHTAGKVAERAMWVHATHCKKVAEPAAAEDVGSRT